MTTPVVTELPRTLEPTTTDPFIDSTPSRPVVDARDQCAQPPRSRQAITHLP